MDQMLPSLGFSIPSIGNPVHKDQQIMLMPLLQPPNLAPSTSSLPNQQQSVNKAYCTNNMGSASPHIMMHSQTPVHQSIPPWMGSSSSVISAIPKIENRESPVATTPGLINPGIVLQLQNIVSTVNMGCQLDLKTIASHALNAQFNPSLFSAVIMRIREPRTTALIFSSGKLVCTGAKSEEDSRLAGRKYARILQKLNFPAKFMDFKIRSIVCSFDVKFPISLERLLLTHGECSCYEPELFPGLIFRMVKPRVAIIIFVTGKVVIAGAKAKQEIFDAYDYIYPILKSFQKKQI